MDESPNIFKAEVGSLLHVTGYQPNLWWDALMGGNTFFQLSNLSCRHTKLK